MIQKSSTNDDASKDRYKTSISKSRKGKLGVASGEPIKASVGYYRKSSSKFSRKALPITRLFPNIITLAALCLGLTSVRYALDSKWEHSVVLLIVAAFLDGMDGRVARYFKATSNFGAQLDSLADFFNFGIAPAIIIYMWTLVGIPIKGVGWGFVLVFSVCCAIRLARFNIALNTDSKMKDMFFTGINAPAGAILAITPMMLSFEFEIEELKNPWFIGVYMLLIAFAMSSRLPTFSIKKISISHQNVALVLAFFGFVIASLVIKPWITISVFSVIYILSIPLSVAMYYKMLAKS